jgi:asparagine synthase (glutamine-hydrolysing)
MCGIAGIIDFGGDAIDDDHLRAAQRALVHRGPDDAAWVREARPDWQVGMVAVRLAIIDPTPAGAQPFRYADRYLLAYNGEIYNYRELRRELKRAGASFTTDSDTEVVAAACAHWGVEALSRFNGMWAFAFIDLEARTGIAWESSRC